MPKAGNIEVSIGNNEVGHTEALIGNNPKVSIGSTRSAGEAIGRNLKISKQVSCVCLFFLFLFLLFAIVHVSFPSLVSFCPVFVSSLFFHSLCFRTLFFPLLSFLILVIFLSFFRSFSFLSDVIYICLYVCRYLQYVTCLYVVSLLFFLLFFLPSLPSFPSFFPSFLLSFFPSFLLSFLPSLIIVYVFLLSNSPSFFLSFLPFPSLSFPSLSFLSCLPSFGLSCSPSFLYFFDSTAKGKHARLLQAFSAVQSCQAPDSNQPMGGTKKSRTDMSWAAGQQGQ